MQFYVVGKEVLLDITGKNFVYAVGGSSECYCLIFFKFFNIVKSKFYHLLFSFF